MSDLVSREMAIHKIGNAMARPETPDGRGLNDECIAAYDEGLYDAICIINDLPSTALEFRHTSYRDCANALMAMRMEKVVTDSEYNQIMLRLDAAWERIWEREREQNGRLY